MNAEFIAMLDYLERERGIKREILLEAVSNALLSASKKSVSASRELRIDINPKTGEIRALAKLLVVDEVTNPADEISLPKASKIDPNGNVSWSKTTTSETGCAPMSLLSRTGFAGRRSSSRAATRISSGVCSSWK